MKIKYCGSGPIFNMALGTFASGEIKAVPIGQEENAKNLDKLDNWEIVKYRPAQTVKTKFETTNKFFETKKSAYRRKKGEKK